MLPHKFLEKTEIRLKRKKKEYHPENWLRNSIFREQAFDVY